MINVYYTPKMVADSGGYSPSARKPEQVVHDWNENRLKCRYHSPEPVTLKDLELAHSAGYVSAIFDGTESNGHGNTSQVVAQSTLWTVGSMVDAAKGALRYGVTCSPTSGFHHAGYDWNHGFCTFNGLIVAAQKLLSFDCVQRVGILDFDMHYGDGTDDIIHRLGLGDWVANITNCGRELLDPGHIAKLIDDSDADVILYQAGADQHIDDPLGGLFSDDELALRDRLVFEHCYCLGIPIAWNLAGGYQRDQFGNIDPVLRIHRQSMLECARVFVPGYSGTESSGETNPRKTG